MVERPPSLSISQGAEAQRRTFEEARREEEGEGRGIRFGH
eukprot:CAMPEP_0118906548 /NCGR_PEP_ID=MMETSP1166-20130328/10251_1 /TAXON_ID=1104430 /ORGANISM="Chrysoreinhardia sp, Strain CCMP3193" /LENGTH=39 /DNA_ID= /DNA_START= /DNA_END= /DNA_ORIENTATION=